jgi:putative ABC transport system ATP-binding protein
LITKSSQVRNMSIVQTRELTKVYKMGHTDVHALRGLSLNIEPGEFMTIMGRSGSGKSTLLNMIGCLDRPTGGTVIIDGVEVSQLPKGQLPRIRREKIGFIFQNFNLIPTLTALENVMLPLRYHRVRNGRQRAMEMLEHVDLADRARHRPSELSGGEQQRVSVARALVTHPAIILADEPTGELDTHLAAEIIALLRRFNQESGQTIIIVTHDPLVAEATDRIVRLQDGQVESDQRLGPKDREARRAG